MNFLDTTETYPVPTTAPNAVPGTTEKYIGTWLAKNPEWRREIIIATKVMGPMPNSKVATNRTVPPAPEPYPMQIWNAFTVDISDELFEKIDVIHFDCKDPYIRARNNWQ